MMLKLMVILHSKKLTLKSAPMKIFKGWRVSLISLSRGLINLFGAQIIQNPLNCKAIFFLAMGLRTYCYRSQHVIQKLLRHGELNAKKMIARFRNSLKQCILKSTKKDPPSTGLKLMKNQSKQLLNLSQFSNLILTDSKVKSFR